MPIKDKISTSIEGSLINLNTQEVPNFQRPSPIWLEREVNESVQLYPVAANYPAILQDDGAWLLEPEGLNLIANNQNLSHSTWLKGSNCIVFPDEVLGPDSSYQADRVVWASGDGSTQSLKRTFYLRAGTEYYFSGILALSGGMGGINDVIRINSGASRTNNIKIASLNNYPNRYRIVEMGFRTIGNQPRLPQYDHNVQYTISTLSSNTVTFTVASDALASGQLNGGKLYFPDINRSYTIVGNTASVANGSVTVNLDASNLVIDGVKAGQSAQFQGASNVAVEIEFYVESTLALNIAGLQIEERSFRTSMIFQNDKLVQRSASNLSYRKSPVALLKTFGVFLDIKDWRGDGNLFGAGNLSAAIASGILQVQVAGTRLTTTSQLPKDANIFIQISEENSDASLYINGVLVAKSNVVNFVGDRHADLNFTSPGLRCLSRFVVFNKLLLDGSPTIGQTATQEVGELFGTNVLIDATAISATAPLIVFPAVTIPAPIPPLAKSQIQEVNIQGGTIVVEDGRNFVADTTRGIPVVVVREGKIVLTPRATNKNGNTLTLDSIYGIVVGDFLVYGNVDQPGRASVRFPFTPIDQMSILDIDTGLKRLRVSSTLSFSKTRSFIHTIQYVDKAEVLIRDKDDQNGYLFVDSVEGIERGDIISQASDELIIDPSCYLAGTLRQIDGVAVEWKFANGLVLTNENDYPVEVEPVIRVYY